MVTSIEISIAPSKLEDLEYIKHIGLSKAKLKETSNTVWSIKRRSIDARGRSPVYKLLLEFRIDEPIEHKVSFIESLTPVKSKKTCIVIGAGPAGYFAALELLAQGINPIVLERGKDVQLRRRDLKAIQQDGVVNPHSNYCFGEGGAGTYSDGKLYTRSHKRGSIQQVLDILVDHGANTDILIDAHPHIGSNKLPNIIASIRKTIEDFGGRVLFDTYVTDILKDDKGIVEVIDQNHVSHKADAYILATGHSARDIFELCVRRAIRIEPKPFAIGVRIEHKQSFIDSVQYNQAEREPNLPASSYSLVCQVGDIGVFSFCMCPGGLIVPAATSPGEIVVNGMSLSRRDSPYANSGFVTAVSNEDIARLGYTGPLANMHYQKDVEQAAFNLGDGSQKAPAARMPDFVNRKISNDLNPTSYIPGLVASPLHEALPIDIYKRLAEGMQVIGKKMKGFYTAEANVVGVESRTSSPVRIPRDKDTFMHPDVLGFFPCGEGAGYAGGILSAAMDGQNVAKAVAKYLA